VPGLERLGATRMRQYVRAWINERDLVRLEPQYRPQTEVVQIAADYSEDGALEGTPETGRQQTLANSTSHLRTEKVERRCRLADRGLVTRPPDQSQRPWQGQARARSSHLARSHRSAARGCQDRRRRVVEL